MPTVVEDVALSLRRRHQDKRERRAAALEALGRFGLADLADRSVHALSGGQRQLLALAGVLATDPDVLVADEPTTLLDLRNTREVADLLFALPQQLVLVTHDLALAQRCDRALLVDDGRVVADGPPADVVDTYRSRPPPEMSLLGLYRPGRTWLHRLPAGAKLLGLLVASLVVVVTGGPVSGVVVLAVAVCVAASSGAGPGPCSGRCGRCS